MFLISRRPQSRCPAWSSASDHPGLTAHSVMCSLSSLPPDVSSRRRSHVTAFVRVYHVRTTTRCVPVTVRRRIIDASNRTVQESSEKIFESGQFRESFGRLPVRAAARVADGRAVPVDHRSDPQGEADGSPRRRVRCSLISISLLRTANREPRTASTESKREAERELHDPRVARQAR